MDELKQLAAARLEAKKAEDAAIAARRAIDEQISTLLADPAKTEGTVTEKLEGVKVSVTYGITRKLDTKALQTAWNTLPEPVQKCINWKAEVSTTKFRDLEKDAVLVLSTYMESKPSTPSVKVEITE